MVKVYTTFSGCDVIVKLEDKIFGEISAYTWKEDLTSGIVKGKLTFTVFNGEHVVNRLAPGYANMKVFFRGEKPYESREGQVEGEEWAEDGRLIVFHDVNFDSIEGGMSIDDITEEVVVSFTAYTGMDIHDNYTFDTQEKIAFIRQGEYDNELDVLLAEIYKEQLLEELVDGTLHVVSEWELSAFKRETQDLAVANHRVNKMLQDLMKQKAEL